MKKRKETRGKSVKRAPLRVYKELPPKMPKPKKKLRSQNKRGGKKEKSNRVMENY